MLKDDDIDVVGWPAGGGVVAQRRLDLGQDFGGIGAVVRLKKRREPSLSENGIRRVHGVGQAVGVNHQRFPRLNTIRRARCAVDHADPQHPRIGREGSRPVRPNDNRRWMSHPSITNEARLLIGDQVEAGAEIASQNTGRERSEDPTFTFHGWPLRVLEERVGFAEVAARAGGGFSAGLAVDDRLAAGGLQDRIEIDAHDDSQNLGRPFVHLPLAAVDSR